MMTKSKVSILIVLVVMLCTAGSVSQSSNAIPAGIVNATKSGDASGLSAYFFNNIELVLPAKTGVFSKKQAEMIVKDFFSKNPPVEFKIIHNGQKESASYAIGNYRTSSGSYRFTFLTKNADKKVLIHQLRIEKQDE